MTLKDQMDHIYNSLSPEEIPWNIEGLPELLVELVESKAILPCRAIDLGCGAGNHIIEMARRGFEMTGIDLSSEAIKLAREKAGMAGVECELIVGDIVGGTGIPGSSFGFAYDWEVLHHIFPGKRRQYLGNIHHILRTGGRYLSVCFSEEDADMFGSTGKYRTTPLGTELYFSSEDELEKLFGEFFRIDDILTLTVPGKKGQHRAVKALMTKSIHLPDSGSVRIKVTE